MSSGIKVSDACFDAFTDFKEGHKYKFVIYKINDDASEVVVESTSADDVKDAQGNVVPRKETEYEEFISRLPSNAGRFAVYDFDYEVEGGKRNKILFYAWAPDTAGVRSKMLYASTKSSLRTRLVGISADIQATDADGLAHDEVLATLMSKFK
ncbi:cofilin [Coemansia javaensis]|uniref:Cofilin n=1 Tax=Coemansia javaensis TaxID=2761396 RepID=A0A9W8HDM3_9FUNG|nr:cofilin [Coemansia javaensis]